MKRYIAFVLFLLCVSNIYAQTDTLIFKNGNMVIGEVKSMNRGVISIETDYSDSDFLIEWDKVAEIYSRQPQYKLTHMTSQNYFLIGQGQGLESSTKMWYI